MKMVKSLILGSAAGLVAIAGAQAADLPVKAKPVQYVKICSLYGAGFYYIPGTDTCIKIGGYVRAELNYQAGGSFNPVRVYNFDSPARDRTTNRVRGGVTVDVRSQTEYGTLRAYAMILPTSTNDGGTGGSPYASPGDFAPAIFIQFAGFTAGKTASFFDFDLQPYSNQTNIWGSNQAGNGISVFAYTAQFGNGMSASLSLEDQTSRRTAVFDPAIVPAIAGYGGRRWPDLVANLRIDQAWGSAQIMGAVHQVRALGNTTTGDHPEDKVGWAAGAGIKLNVPMLGKGDFAIAQFTYSEGAMNYVGNHLSNFSVRNGYPVVTSRAVGPVADAVQTSATSMDLTKGWSVTGGFQHNWVPGWKTSLYGAYGALNYSDAATLGLGGVASGDADFSFWQAGSRTVWTPVQNLDLSVEVMYNKLNTAFDNVPGNEDKGWWQGMFRVQRNFYP